MSGTDIATIKQHLKHPIVDCDGHWREWHPIFVEYLHEVAGPKLAEQYLASRSSREGRDGDWLAATPEQRMAKRLRRDVGWANLSKNVVDYATAKLPALMKARISVGAV